MRLVWTKRYDLLLKMVVLLFLPSLPVNSSVFFSVGDYHVVLHIYSAIAAETLDFGTSSQMMEYLGWLILRPSVQIRHLSLYPNNRRLLAGILLIVSGSSRQ